jgi:hypothetical protein
MAPRHCLVSFVPNTNGAIGSHGLVEGFPSGQVLGFTIFGVGKELIHGAPVLHHQGGSGEPRFCMQEPMLWLCVEFFDHLGHGQDDRQPLVHQQRLVDAYAYEEYNEFAIHVGC